MPINQALLPEFDQEMANTRKTLERTVGEKWSWKPHEKSGTMGWLAGHTATIPGWVAMTLGQDSLDMSGFEPPPIPAGLAEVLAMFDKNVAEARGVIAAASDETMMQPWTLLKNGNAIFTMPKVAVLRSFVLNHIIHHRAQLGVYLRLNDIPVPSIYGPSADEGQM